LSTQHGPTLSEENCVDSCGCGIPENGRKPVSDGKIAEPLLQLQREHKLVLRECASLARIANEIGRNKAVNQKLVRKAISCIQQLRSLLTDHESREDRILIPIIQERLDSEASASVMREHVQISEMLQRLEEILLQPDIGMNNQSHNHILDPVARFDSFIRVHFSREENVLFWFASLYIPTSNSGELGLRPPKSENRQQSPLAVKGHRSR
jgi:hemerythrin-like domain-containing protein